MKDELELLYDELKSKVNEERLRTISAEIINGFREKNDGILAWYSDLLGINEKEESDGRMFARIIQVYHPDKLAAIHNEIEGHYRKKDLDELLRLKNAFLFRREEIPRTYEPVYDEDEEYRYGDDDFGYEERPLDDYDEEEDEYDEEAASDGEEYGFIEAMNRSMYGNLGITVTANDIRDLDGELDLSDYDISDLTGVENCINITALNLSCNRLDRLSHLAGLVQLECLYISENDITGIEGLAAMKELRELDISFNEIEDISVLLSLPNLRYVNVIGNPIRTKDVLRELEKRKVIVLY
jgi:hypothetical protein